MIGKLSRVPLRKVWKHEAYDLTTWLTDNPDVLSDAIKMKLENVESEQAAGNFAVDIRAEDSDGNIVVVENQLERSDHNHLGTLITYVSSLDATTAVWIVSEPRPEHTGAINWLNEAGTCNFFLLKIEAVQIGTSEPAPLLTLITGPSEEALKVGQTKKDFAERHDERHRFWAEFLHRARKKSRLYANVSPGRKNWISAGVGWSGLDLNYVVWQEESGVEVYIDTGDETENLRVFDGLQARSSEIEQSCGTKSRFRKS